eukprot:scaffold4209_cov445-Pinguiococcus_pyrenoidosus.AAC.1
MAIDSARTLARRSRRVALDRIAPALSLSRPAVDTSRTLARLRSPPSPISVAPELAEPQESSCQRFPICQKVVCRACPRQLAAGRTQYALPSRSGRPAIAGILRTLPDLPGRYAWRRVPSPIR